VRQKPLLSVSDSEKFNLNSVSESDLGLLLETADIDINLCEAAMVLALIQRNSI
jgi:hypothetical protein